MVVRIERIQGAGVNEEILEGARVRITLPDDVLTWGGASGPYLYGVVVFVNGDSVDIALDGGDIEPFDIDLVTAYPRPLPAGDRMS